MGLFSFSPLIWQYAVTAEVFPMNTMFSALIAFLTVVFSRTRSIYIAVLGSFICGLALCNQHTIVLYEIPLILSILFLIRNLLYKRPAILLYLSLAFLIGILPYIYLPLAAIYNPQPGSWGHVATFSGLIHHLLRRDYGTFQVSVHP
jgi:hypothetical protein